MWLKQNAENKSGLVCGKQYLRLGYYADSISEYQRVFGKESVKIYLNEELKNHPQELFYDLFDFLGLDTFFQPDVREKFNVNENVSMRGTMQNLFTAQETNQESQNCFLLLKHDPFCCPLGLR
jgi:hypothetical protein